MLESWNLIILDILTIYFICERGQSFQQSMYTAHVQFELKVPFNTVYLNAWMGIRQNYGYLRCSEQRTLYSFMSPQIPEQELYFIQFKDGCLAVCIQTHNHCDIQITNV